MKYPASVFSNYFEKYFKTAVLQNCNTAIPLFTFSLTVGTFWLGSRGICSSLPHLFG